MTSTFPLLSLLVFSPLLGVLLVLTFRDAHQGRAAQWGAVTSSLVTAILSLFVWTAFQEGTAGLQLVERFTWIGSFGIDYFLGLDGLNLFFLVAAAWLQPLILIASWNMQERAWQFNLHLLLLQCGVLGCFVALDVILFYVFFELMLIPLYFLIGGWGRAQSLVAANRFFIYTGFTTDARVPDLYGGIVLSVCRILVISDHRLVSVGDSSSYSGLAIPRHVPGLRN